MISVENLRPSGWLFIPFAIVLLQLSGCAVGPKYHSPAVETPAAYKKLGNWKPAQANDQNLGGTWWTIFQDPQLDALALEGNVSNQNLKAAEAHFRQARAVLRYNRADYCPTVTAGPSATRTRVSNNLPPSVQRLMASPTTTLRCRSTFPTRRTSGDEFGAPSRLLASKPKLAP